MKNKKYSLKEVIEVCKNRNIIYLDTYYNNCKEIHNFVCGNKKCNNEWKTRFDNIVNSNSKCPKCSKNHANSKKSLFTNFIKIFCFNRNIIFLDDVFLNCHYKHNFLCLICLKMLKTGFMNIRKGGGCKYCAWKQNANSRKPTVEEIKQIFYKKGLLYLDDFYNECKEKHNFQCLNPTCLKKWATILDVANRAGYSCIFCGNGRRKTVYSLDEVKEICFKNNILYIDNYYNNSDEMHYCRCLKCFFEWPTSFRSINHCKTGCPRCAFSLSRGEFYLYEAFLNLSNKNILNIKSRDRKIISPYEIDILLKTTNNPIAIHYNGRCHYFPIYGSSLANKVKSLKKIQKNDFIKNKLLLSYNFNIFIIKDISKSRNKYKSQIDNIFLKIVNLMDNLIILNKKSQIFEIDLENQTILTIDTPDKIKCC